MSEFIWIAGMFLLGGGLAAVWLFGLWWDVRDLVRRERPGTRLILGALARLTLVAAGFCLVITGGRHWTHLIAALAGFIFVRYAVLITVRRRAEIEPSASSDSS